MTWETFLEVCEKARPGSAAKLERIQKKKEANYYEDILKEESASLILIGLFFWGGTEEEEKDPLYWNKLHDKLKLGRH